MRTTLKTDEQAENNLVEEYMIGGTKIKIYNDAYINKSASDIKRSIRKIEKMAYAMIKDNYLKANKASGPQEATVAMINIES